MIGSAGMSRKVITSTRTSVLDTRRRPLFLYVFDASLLTNAQPFAGTRRACNGNEAHLMWSILNTEPSPREPLLVLGLLVQAFHAWRKDLLFHQHYHFGSDWAP